MIIRSSCCRQVPVLCCPFFWLLWLFFWLLLAIQNWPQNCTKLVRHICICIWRWVNFPLLWQDCLEWLVCQSIANTTFSLLVKPFKILWNIISHCLVNIALTTICEIIWIIKYASVFHEVLGVWITSVPGHSLILPMVFIMRILMFNFVSLNFNISVHFSDLSWRGSECKSLESLSWFLMQ